MDRSQIFEEYGNLFSIEYSPVQVFQRGRYESIYENKDKYSTKFENVCYPFFIYVPTLISYPNLHKFLETRVTDLIEIQNDPMKGIINHFDIYVVDKNNKGAARGRKLFEFDISVVAKVNLSNSVIYIEWSALGIKDGAYRRIVNNIPSETFEAENDKVTLIDCFSDYVAQEKLSQDESWFCPSCKNLIQANKKMEIYRAPDIYVIHLKRFTKHGIGMKLDLKVEYPVEGLDLTPFVKLDSNDKIYDLFGVVCHVGPIACAGHYTAFCLNTHDQKWYYFDDANVREVRKDQVVSRNAYILFYKKRSVETNTDFSFL